MSRFFFGLFVGVFICISLLEIAHKTVEYNVEGEALCSVAYDRLSKKWGPGLVYRIKVVYKAFAYPSKEIFIYFTDPKVEKNPRLEVSDGNGNYHFESIK